MSYYKKINEFLEENKENIFSDLKKLVMAEATTSDIIELKNTREILKGIITERLGLEIKEHPTESGRNPISFQYGNGPEKVTIVGHYDTVCPIGSIPIKIVDNKFGGLGVLDMKGGLIQTIWTIKGYKDLEIPLNKNIQVIINGDEEIGSPDSSKIICDLAKGSKAALVCEPCVSNGNLKTGRKGVQSFIITIHGKSGHAGNNHKDGINAIEEMAREIQAFHELTNYQEGTTISVGSCQGGTKLNVIPELATFGIDCRYTTVESGQKIAKAIFDYVPTLEGIKREVKHNLGFPPMEQKEGNIKLYEKAKVIGEKLGLFFSHEFVGGGSDGNNISHLGIPILDGLGPHGDGAHTPDEFIYVDQYIPRILLLSLLILDI